MTSTLFWLFAVAAILISLVAEAVASWAMRRKIRHDDFDGGYSIENETHITRVYAPFIISKGDHHK